MHHFVAGAGVAWRVPPGGVAELSLAELSPASACASPPGGASSMIFRF